MSRKRKAPVASSVVRVDQAADEDSDDAEEEETSYGAKGLSSRVSLPSKPERKSVLRSYILFCFSILYSMFFLCFLLNLLFIRLSGLIYFRPTLPPAKQANRNLILKAISEAQDSITKTTSYATSMFPTTVHLTRKISF